jgi:IclR family transcriptional regulator, KDG regulon repressor
MSLFHIWNSVQARMTFLFRSFLPEKCPMATNTLEKAIRILELLSENAHGLPLSEISRDLDFPKSTTHHILQTFLRHHYVTQNVETKRYGLGVGILQISSTLLANLDINKIAEGYLQELYTKTREIVHLYILREGKIACIAKVGNPRGLTLSSFVGWTTEPHAAGAGKVLLSEEPREKILSIYPDKVLRRYGKKTITDFDELFRELRKIRSQGYAIDDEEYYQGIRCIAAPVRAGNRVVASVSCTGPIFRMTMERIRGELVSLVKQTAEDISRNLKDVRL